MEELKLNESQISREWEGFALNQKISEDYIKHLEPFKKFLKKNFSRIMLLTKQKFNDVLQEEDPKMFENIEFEDIIFDTDDNMNTVDENSTIPMSINDNIPTTYKAPTKTTTTTRSSSMLVPKRPTNNNPNTVKKEVIIEDDIGEFEFRSDIKIDNLPIRQKQATEQTVPYVNYKDRKNIGSINTTFNLNEKENVINPTLKEKEEIGLKGAGEEFYPIKYHSDTLEHRTKTLKDSVVSFLKQDQDMGLQSFPVSLDYTNENENNNNEINNMSSIVRSIGRVWMYDQETLLSKRFYLLGDQQAAAGGSGSGQFNITSNASTSVYSLENDIKEYAMFPGQILMAESKKIAGSNFYFSNKVYYPNALPFYGKGGRKECGDINIMVSSGPFDLQKSVPDYTALDDLCNVVADKKPHILLLMGPFIDDSNLHISKYSETYSELFNNLMKKLNQKIPSSVKVLIVPSLKDVDHDYILPQPPYNPLNININDNILFVPNPFTLIINDSFTIGITSTDIYNHLESKSYFKDNQHTPGDIFNMLINQKSYYPMHPAQAPIGMKYLQHLNFPGFTPDILIVSKSAPIATTSNDVLCLGVPPLIGGKSTFGSYAEITVTKSNQTDTCNNIPVSKRSIVNFKNI